MSVVDLVIGNIPVTFSGAEVLQEDHGLVITGDYQEFVSVHFYGKNADLKTLDQHKDEIKAVVDVSKVRSTKEYTMTYDITLPSAVSASSITRADKTPTSITFTVERQIRKSVEVKGDFSNVRIAEGFMLYGAASVEAVDVSEEALALVRRNAALNGVADRVTTTCANVFDLARQYAAEGRQYGLVICDPPAFAKSRKVLESAYRGYKELNLQCMKLVRPGGFLVSCSCSQFMTPELFLRMLREAAQDAGRDARLLEPLMQSRDHPASLSSEQSLYLKGDILQIL